MVSFRVRPAGPGFIVKLMALLSGLIAIACAGLFAGAAVYVSLVEHPARMACGLRVALTQFRPSYRRAAVMQASLATVGALVALARWLAGGQAGWLVGALLLVFAIVFTLVVIMPTNQRLLDPGLEPESPEAGTLLRRWERLHAVRSVAGCAAFGLFMTSLAGG